MLVITTLPLFNVLVTKCNLLPTGTYFPGYDALLLISQNVRFTASKPGFDSLVESHQRLSKPILLNISC